MKKVLLVLLVLCLLMTLTAYAEEEKTVGGNVALHFYPTNTSLGGGVDFNHSNIWLEGNLLVGNGLKWKGTLEWFGGTRTKNFTGIGNVRFQQSQFIGRVGYDFWDRTFATISYKNHKNTVSIVGVGTGSGTFSGIGFGVDKDWKLGSKWNLCTNLHYHPTLSGPGNWDYRNFEYEIGVTYKWENAVNVDLGYRGESWNGFNNAAGSNVTISGPYIGISKDF